MSTSSTLDAEIRLGRLTEVRYVTGLARSSVYELMRAGKFPASVQIGTRAVAWRMDEVTDWIRSRPRATAAPAQ